jgi:hypothetical protein
VSDTHISFGKSLIGYNKDQVNRYMSKLAQQRKDSVDELKKNIAELSTDNLILERELERLKQQLTYSLEQEDLMKFALLKLEEKIISVFDKLAEEELISISMLGETQEMSYNTKINDYLNKVKNLGNSGNLKFSTADTNIDAGKDIYDTELSSGISNNVEALKSQDFSIYYKDPNSVKQFFTSDYWGYDLKDVPYTSAESDTILENPAAIAEKAITEAKQPKFEPLQEITQEADHFAELKYNSKAGLIPEPVVEHNQIENKEMTRSTIKDVRLKYLIGKIVGEDLMDKKGKLLAKNGTTITEILVEIASITGVLSELIINMKLPEASQ